MRILVKFFGPQRSFVPYAEEVHGHPYVPHPVSTEGDNTSTFEVEMKWEQHMRFLLFTAYIAFRTWSHAHPLPTPRLLPLCECNVHEQLSTRGELIDAQSIFTLFTSSRDEVVH
jgi:hypothetical protein